jgi:hypothetical protein
LVVPAAAAAVGVRVAKVGGSLEVTMVLKQSGRLPCLSRIHLS